jgi:pimeloyl-ACP methyl ester carboxylesterase
MNSLGSKVWKFTKLVLLSLLGLILALVCSGAAYRGYRHHAIAKATRIDLAKGIDEGLFVKIGGIDQWITIRGQDRDNPVLLLLHGGPGVATSPYPRTELFAWTKDFTLVLWDQRGAGRTFSRSGPLDPDVTIDRMALDGVEVAEFLRQKLHKPKIVLLGLSWGSVMGIHMAKARPDLLYAYVGTGQMVNAVQEETIDYADVMEKARARGDRDAFRELEKIGPPPYDSQSKMGVQRKWATAYEPGGRSPLSLLSTILFESDVTFQGMRDYISGVTNSQNHFFGETMSGPLTTVDLKSLGTDFAVPIFIFQGAEDDVAATPLARAYVDAITAPQKEFVAIADAGHTAMYTRSDEFLRLLVNRVRPIALQPERASSGMRSMH